MGNKLFALALAVIVLMVAVLGGDGTMCVITAPIIGVLLFTKFNYTDLQHGDPRGRD